MSIGPSCMTYLYDVAAACHVYSTSQSTPDCWLFVVDKAIMLSLAYHYCLKGAALIPLLKFMQNPSWITTIEKRS